MINQKLQSEKDKYYKKYHKFPTRSCSICLKYPCFIGIENAKADFAKYGCKKYKDK